MRDSAYGKKCSVPASAAPGGGTNVSAIFAPSPRASTFQPASGCGSAARAAAIRGPHVASACAAVATGSVNVRSAPSGMHVSLQTSQSARAASVAAVPGFASAGGVIVTRWSTSPS